MNINIPIVIISSGNDMPYILKIIEKHNQNKIILITAGQFSENLLNKFFDDRQIDVVNLDYIYFSHLFKLKEYKQILKIINTYKVLLKIKNNLHNKAKIFFLNEFHNFVTFSCLRIFKNYKCSFISTLRFLKVSNVSLFDIPDIGKKYKLLYLINLIVLKLFFSNQISVSYYELNINFFKKRYLFNKDYYKVHGFALNDQRYYKKIIPYNFKKLNKSKIVNNRVLYLFSSLEQVSTIGIDYNNSYLNILNYLISNFKEIDIKCHPNMKQNFEFFEKFKKSCDVKFIDNEFPAEYHISNYNKIIVNYVSNSVRHYIETNREDKKEFFSLIDLIKFNDNETKFFFNQMFDVVFFDFKDKVVKVI